MIRSRLLPPSLLSLLLVIAPSTARADETFYRQHSITSGIASRLLTTLRTEDRKLRAFAYDQNGHWFLLTEDGARYYSDTAYFDAKMGFRAKMTELLGNGTKIESVAFTPGGNWVISTPTRVHYSSAASFQNIGFYQRAEQLKAAGVAIKSIAFGPNNFWVIVRADGLAQMNDQALSHPDVAESEIGRVLGEAQAGLRRIDAVAIRPRATGKPEYVVVSGTRTFMYPHNDDAFDEVSSLNEARREITAVAMDPTDGVVAFSNGAAPPASGVERLELGLKYNNDCAAVEAGCDYDSTGSIWDRMRWHKIAGAQIVVIEGGNVSRVHSYGYRNREASTHVLRDTKFSAASLSKLVAGVAFLRARETHDMVLESRTTRDVRYYIHNGADGFVKDWYDSLSGTQKDRINTGIAVGDLLSMTGGFNVHGIGLYPPEDKPGLYHVLRGYNPATNEKVVPDTYPRNTMDYSGGGYAVAQTLLEGQVGTSFGTYVSANVLSPLGMNRSLYRSLTASERQHLLAYPHDESMATGSYKECPVDTAGGLYTTADDYARLLKLVMDQGYNENGNNQLIPSNRVRDAFRPRVLNGTQNACTSSNQDTVCSDGESCVDGLCQRLSNYAYGASISGSRGADDMPETMKHSGAQDYYRAYFEITPERGDGIVILTNSPKEIDGTRVGGEAFRAEVMRSYRTAFAP